MDFTLGGPHVITHGLGTTDVFVQVMMKEPDGNIHQRPMDIWWQNLTPNEITVMVMNYPNSQLGYYGDFRVMLWKIAEP